jgi:hypothetical protein
MSKTLQQFLEVYRPKSADEQKFVDKHVTVKNKDRNGNGDDVFKATNVKVGDRKNENHGYDAGEDEKVYEALKGNQHKIDANKNGKIDAHDFHLLRKKKKVAEEAEELGELSQKMVRAYRDKARDDKENAEDDRAFYKAYKDNTSAEDKKIRKRTAGIKMADKKIYGGAKVRMGEESEQIDEISKKLASNYLQKKHERDYDTSADGTYSKLKKPKTFDQMNKDVKSGVRAANILMKKEDAEQIDEISAEKKDAYAQKAGKQLPGLFKKSKSDADAARTYYNRKNTVRKIANEEAEELDELSKSTMGRYINKAATKMGSQGVTAGLKIAADEKSTKNFKDMGKREKGIARAVNKLTREEVEEYFYDITSEANADLLMSVFEQLGEDNQDRFLEACQTPDGVDAMLDFSIKNRNI